MSLLGATHERSTDLDMMFCWVMEMGGASGTSSGVVSVTVVPNGPRPIAVWAAMMQVYAT